MFVVPTSESCITTVNDETNLFRMESVVMLSTMVTRRQDR